MDREVHCPVCRSPMLVSVDLPPTEKTCPVCGTSFKLPLRRRKASEGAREGAVEDGEAS